MIPTNWNCIWHIYSDNLFGNLLDIDIFWHSVSHSIWHILTIILADIYSDILSFMLSDISSDILSGILFDISSEILRGQGPAGITLIQRLLFGSGGGHCDLALAVDMRSDRALAVRFRWGSLRSGGCSWHALWSCACGSGLAGNTAIWHLQLMSGGESDLTLAVRFRQGTLRSGACSRLRFGFGREHCDLVLAVEVGGTTLILGLLFRSGWSACSWSPATRRRRRARRGRRRNWHKI